jgi:dynein intermediate chain 2
VLWWDVRNLAEPTDACVLPDDFGGCCIEWQQEAGPSKYLVGTEEGVGLALNKKPKKAVEVGGTWFGDSRNCGPVCAIKRNFFHPKYFLTVGDYSVRLWTEDLRSAVWKTRPSGARLTCGGWSSVRAGVFFAARLDGVVEFHDLVSQMNASVYSHKVGDTPLSSLSLEGGGGRLLAVGDSAGGVTLVELCEELVSTTSAEKSAVGALLDREQRRERNLDALKKSAKSTPGGTFQENKTLFDTTIDKQQYIAREQEWLAATGMPTDRGGWGVDSLL